ncbi:MAG: hypothetical protein II232_01905 [Spirochaetaceae bacterium]|nr:hypothetical protein [Spirochaetaceae bacterium]
MILLITFNNIFCQKNSNSIFELSWKLDIPLCVTGLTIFTLPHLLPTEDVIYNPNEIRDLSNVNSFDRWSAQKYSKQSGIFKYPMEICINGWNKNTHYTKIMGKYSERSASEKQLFLQCGQKRK